MVCSDLRRETILRLHHASWSGWISGGDGPSFCFPWVEHRNHRPPVLGGVLFRGVDPIILREDVINMFGKS